MHRKIELLAPAGNMEKLKMAVLYGADAVYLAGKSFGLRTASDNFSMAEMAEGVDFAHSRGKRVYLAMNAIPRNHDLKDAESFLRDAVSTGIDAVIISDPGFFDIARASFPELPIHISTQANVTNYGSALFWQRLGASRIILARELSLDEITGLRERVPDIELEVFVHGSMCISYSGRCLLSNYLAGRDANAGDCAHPCRWRYFLTEEKRPGQYYPIEEDASGAYILNSKDLCMIDHIPELIKCGVTSLKIEGRVKSSFYVATVVKAYREAIDAYYEDREANVDELIAEVSKVSNRDFTTGFFFGKPARDDHNYATSSYIRGYSFVGLVKGYDPGKRMLAVEQRNRFERGDTIEILPPEGPVSEIVADELFDGEGNRIEAAPHPQMDVYIGNCECFPENSILRKKTDSG